MDDLKHLKPSELLAVWLRLVRRVSKPPPGVDGPWKSDVETLKAVCDEIDRRGFVPFGNPPVKPADEKPPREKPEKPREIGVARGGRWPVPVIDIDPRLTPEEFAVLRAADAWERLYGLTSVEEYAPKLTALSSAVRRWRMKHIDGGKTKMGPLPCWRCSKWKPKAEMLQEPPGLWQCAFPYGCQKPKNPNQMPKATEKKLRVSAKKFGLDPALSGSARMDYLFAWAVTRWMHENIGTPTSEELVKSLSVENMKPASVPRELQNSLIEYRRQGQKSRLSKARKYLMVRERQFVQTVVREKS